MTKQKSQQNTWEQRWELSVLFFFKFPVCCRRKENIELRRWGLSYSLCFGKKDTTQLLLSSRTKKHSTRQEVKTKLTQTVFLREIIKGKQIHSSFLSCRATSSSAWKKGFSHAWITSDKINKDRTWTKTSQTQTKQHNKQAVAGLSLKTTNCLRRIAFSKRFWGPFF